MACESVGDVLKNLHSALRPNGSVLDIHPLPQNSGVEIWRAGKIELVGELSETRTTCKVIAARAVRATIIEQGYFAIAAERVFDFCYHFDTFDEWADYLDKASWFDSEADAGLIGVVEGVWRDRPGEIVIREGLYGARLDRVDGEFFRTQIK